MIVTEPDNFWEYSGNDNVLVVPITKFVKKDGTLAMVDDIAKEAADKYPSLPRRWGYFMETGVEYPTYRAEGVNLLGVPVRDHYASKEDEELIESGLWYIYDIAFNDSHNNIYYVPLLGGPDFLELHKNILDNTSIYSNVIVLAEGISDD